MIKKLDFSISREDFHSTTVKLGKRATQGVRLINLKGDQKVATVALVSHEETETQEQEEVNKN